MIDAPFHSREEMLALQLASRPELMNPVGRDLAEAQHVCREINSSAQSCERLHEAISANAACQMCTLLRDRRREAEGVPPLPQPRIPLV